MEQQILKYDHVHGIGNLQCILPQPMSDLTVASRARPGGFMCLKDSLLAGSSAIRSMYYELPCAATVRYSLLCRSSIIKIDKKKSLLEILNSLTRKESAPLGSRHFF